MAVKVGPSRRQMSWAHKPLKLNDSVDNKSFMDSEKY